MKHLYTIILFAFVFQMANAQKLNTNIIKTIENQGASITGVKFTPDSKKLITLNNKKEIIVYEIVNNKLHQIQKVKDDRIESFDNISIDENNDVFFYTVNSKNGVLVDFYKLTNNSFIKNLSYTNANDKKYQYKFIGVSPNDRTLVIERFNSKNYQNDILIYMIVNKEFKLTNKYNINYDSYSGLSKSNIGSPINFSEDKKSVALNDKIFEFKNKQVKTLTGAVMITKLWTTDNYYSYDINSNKKLKYNGAVKNFENYGNIFIDLNKDYVYKRYNWTISTYLVKNNKYNFIAHNEVEGLMDDLSKDGNYFVSAGGPAIYLYRVDNGNLILADKNIDKNVEGSAVKARFSYDNKLLATESITYRFSTIKVYDFKKSISLINQIKNEYLIGFINEHTLITRTKDKWFKLYTYDTDNSYSVDSANLKSDIVFLSNNNAISINSGNINLYELKNNKFIKIKSTKIENESEIYLLFYDGLGGKISSSGKYLVKKSNNRQNGYFDLVNVKKDFQVLKVIPEGNHKYRPCFTFSYDDKYLFHASLKQDNTITAYNNNGGSFNNIQTIFASGMNINGLEISYDNKYMVICVDNKFQIMQIDGEH